MFVTSPDQSVFVSADAFRAHDLCMRSPAGVASRREDRRSRQLLLERAVQPRRLTTQSKKFLTHPFVRQRDFQFSYGFQFQRSPPFHSNKDLILGIDLDCSFLPVHSVSQVCRLGIPHALDHITLLSIPHDLINLLMLLPLLLRLRLNYTTTPFVTVISVA